MGKKPSISRQKISKKETSQSCNSLLKVLRPKVYITDSSSFKSLVQELTGNGRAVGSQFPTNQLNQAVTNQAKVIQIEEDHIEECYQETSIGGSSSSTTTSFDSSKEEVLNQLLPYDDHLLCLEDTTWYDQRLSDQFSPPPVDVLDCQYLDVEALLLDADLEQNHPFFAGPYQYHQEEVNLCDYEFWGLV